MLQFNLIDKDQFIRETIDLKVSAKLSVKLAMNIPLEIEGSGRYQTQDDERKETHRLILSFHQTTHTEEIPKQKYMEKQKEVSQNKILKSALFDDEATHVVTYIEYGSDLFIELTYEGKICYKIFN